MKVRNKKSVNGIIDLLDNKLKKQEKGLVIGFDEFLSKSSEKPLLIFRNVFQLFNNMIHSYIVEEDEYGDDPESINYKTIYCDKLLVHGADTPFFADLPLANRLARLADSFKEGTLQNKVYIFIGPPGSGKSTLLNNLLRKFQEYTFTPEGINYELLWRLDDTKIGPEISEEVKALLEDYYKKTDQGPKTNSRDIFEVPCPSHDHPFLIIPKKLRIEVLENLLSGEDKVKIFNKKEFAWVFKNIPCTICTSIFNALSNKLGSPAEVFKMVYAKRFCYDRSLANGISVYNPGDRDPEKMINTNDVIQRELSIKFKDSNIVKYVFSKYAKTNNGVYVIMDVKGHNEKRLLDLHGIISEGTHKIDDIEENVHSLFIAVMNPEDEKKIATHESFKDRIEEIDVNYILNYDEETKIYIHSFGSQIKKRFLPGVLNNFAKIIISSRVNCKSEAIKEWIKEPKKYNKYCDEDLLLLKLSIYNNKIPGWLTDEDYSKFDRKMRRRIIGESDLEGREGISGRESIAIFNEFYGKIRKKYPEQNGNKKHILITMNDVSVFFKKHEQYMKKIPKGFIESIIRLYNYNVMQQIKECLFHQNEERISNDIQNYLCASTYDAGEKVLCPYTDENIEVNDNFFNSIEQNLFVKSISAQERKKYRDDVANRFTISLQEMQVSDSNIITTPVYKELYNTYMKNLRENIFQPFLQYTSFENAIKEFGTKKFDVYDNRTKEQVRFLLKNLNSKYKYTQEGARQVCLYVLNNKVAEKFNKG